MYTHLTIIITNIYSCVYNYYNMFLSSNNFCIGSLMFFYLFMKYYTNFSCFFQKAMRILCSCYSYFCVSIIPT